MKRSTISFTCIGALVLGMTLIISLNACQSAQAENSTPRRIALIQQNEHGDRPIVPNEIAIAPSEYVYIVDRGGFVMVFDKTEWVASIPWPEYNGGTKTGAQIIAHPDNGYIYLADGTLDMVHVIRNTEVITSLHIGGRFAQNLTVDERSGYVYAFGSKQMLPGYIPIDTVGIIDGAEVISQTEWQHVWTDSIAYNPVDERIYLGQQHWPSFQSLNMVLQLDAGQLITDSVLPAEEYGGIKQIAVNPETGEIYMLRDKFGILYWDGNEFTNFNLPQRENGDYYSLRDIDIDTNTGLAYAASWDGPPSHVVVFDKGEMVAEIALPGDNNSAIAVDEKNNYVYVASYYSGSMSVIRGTEVITTMSTGGLGPSNIAIDDRTDLIYVANADSGSVAIFGFDDQGEPSFWETFFPLLEK